MGRDRHGVACAATSLADLCRERCAAADLVLLGFTGQEPLQAWPARTSP